MTEDAFDLTLPFLGKRDYLHGTTLFDALRARAPATASLAFKFSSLIQSDRVRVRKAVGQTSETAGYATLTAVTPSGVATMHVTPLPRSESLQRVEYNEALVTDTAQLGERVATFQGPWPFTFVATVIPLHKALLSREVTGLGAGQWLFTKLDLSRHPDPASPLALELTNTILGGRMVRSAILVAGQHVGYVSFSWLGKD